MSAGQLSLFSDTSSRRPPAAHYPERPGFKALGSSEEAASQAAGSAARLRRAVLAELRVSPGTADEIAARLRRSPLSVRPRVSELRAMKEITTTGERRRNESGMSASVWKVITSTTSMSEVMS